MIFTWITHFCIYFVFWLFISLRLNRLVLGCHGGLWFYICSFLESFRSAAQGVLAGMGVVNINLCIHTGLWISSCNSWASDFKVHQIEYKLQYINSSHVEFGQGVWKVWEITLRSFTEKCISFVPHLLHFWQSLVACVLIWTTLLSCTWVYSSAHCYMHYDCYVWIIIYIVPSAYMYFVFVLPSLGLEMNWDNLSLNVNECLEPRYCIMSEETKVTNERKAVSYIH